MVNFWIGFTDMNKIIVFESNINEGSEVVTICHGLNKNYIISYSDKNAA
jgi:hypothetical protein